MSTYQRDAGATDINTQVLTVTNQSAAVSSYGTADLLNINGEILSSGISISESNGVLTATITINSSIEPGFYRVLYNTIRTTDVIEPFSVKSKVFTVAVTDSELEAGGWTVRAGSSVKTLFDATAYNSLLENKPKTFFFEKDGYMYTHSGLNYRSLIPQCNRYIFPSKYVWGADPAHSGLINYYRTIGDVGVDAPVHSISTATTYGGFNEELHNTLSGLSAFPISTSGQYIYTDDYKVAWRFWEPSFLEVYNNTISKYKNATNSGVDFINYQSYEDLNTQLRNNPDDFPNYMLDLDTFGWYGAPPWRQWQWYNGLHKHAQSVVTLSDYVETREPWFSVYPALSKLDEGAATIIYGLSFEDDEWDEGEIWEYISQVITVGREVIIAYTNERNCTEVEAKLGKAIALCTDSYFSPGEANYSILQNYDVALYTQYRLGSPLGPPYKIGTTIKRSFVGGWVEIDDDGVLTSTSVRIYEGIKV